MPISNKVKNQHLLWRAGFGPMIEAVADLDKTSPKDLWQLLLKGGSETPSNMNIATDVSKDKTYQDEDGNFAYRKVSEIDKRLIAARYRKDLLDMNTGWVNTMTNSKAQLRQKLTFFWHGHFACRSRNAFFSQELFNGIQKHALGNFGDLLKVVSKSPAMLQFLNNQQNRKARPNENFAREVMELFTLGRGNYTEKDIKEAARAFTGWEFTPQGSFNFRKATHDDGEKTVFGKTGNFDGDDILNLLLEKEQTALYITEKIYKFFVNEKLNKENVQWLASRFYKNQYDITSLLNDIFTSTWFFEEKNIGNKIKSPIELLVGIKRMLPLQTANENAVAVLQRALGQVLFVPPNVAGWPGGKSWIDSSTLMLRLQIPQLFAAEEILQIKLKSDDDTDMGMMNEQIKFQIGKRKLFAGAGATADINWTPVFKAFEKITRPNLLTTITDTLLQTKNKPTSNILQKYTSEQSREKYIQTAILHLMATPEYQMC
jgi:uncharacterized protein (DUF1800 family)